MLPQHGYGGCLGAFGQPAEYPENLASLAYRIGVNYVVYHLTH